MDKDKKEKKVGEDMATALSKKQDIIKAALNKISAKANFLTAKDNMIELDPDNPQHVEWFKEDEEGK